MVAVVVVVFLLFIRTKVGRHIWDKFKLKVPVVGPVISKVAISRFTRTLGTLVSSGVPILQALTIVKETAGNVIISNAVSAVHESVKEGETITAPLEASGVFPPMVISMVDVGEQTGALPEMLAQDRRQLRRGSGQRRGGHDLAARTHHDRVSGRRRRQHRHRHVLALDCHDFQP